MRIVKGRAKYCSAECRTALERRRWQARAALKKQDPDVKAAVNAEERQRRADPIKGENVRAAERITRALRRQDEAKRKLDARNKKRWYESNRDRLREKRRRIAQRRTASEIIAVAERNALYRAQSHLRKTEFIDAGTRMNTKTPNQREARAARKAERELSEFIAQAKTVLDKIIL